MTPIEDGDAVRQVEELRSEVGRLQTYVRDLEEELLRQGHRSFREMVRYERNRSQRYNHYFAVISIECDSSKDTADAMETVRTCVRNVDIVDFLSDDGPVSEASASSQSGETGSEERCSRAVMRSASSKRAGKDGVFRIGIVLPHANESGAKLVSARISARLNHGLRKTAVAIYPTDSTDWARLLSHVGG